MGALLRLLLAFLHLICIAIDIAIFFLVVRLLLTWRSISWLERLDKVGKELVYALTANVGRLWYRVAEKKLSTKGELLVSVLALSIARLLLSEIAILL
jgi:hypothetical protein